MAQGVGLLTFDEQHEIIRRRILRSQSQGDNHNPLSHLYGGVKGLGVGVFGGLTAIAKNTITATQKDGVSVFNLNFLKFLKYFRVYFAVLLRVLLIQVNNLYLKKKNVLFFFYQYFLTLSMLICIHYLAESFFYN